jgi:peptide/nickel transport system permease protein
MLGQSPSDRVAGVQPGIEQDMPISGMTTIVTGPALEPEQVGLPVGPGEGGGYQKRKLGVFFWIAAGWLIVLVLCASFAGLLPLKDPEHTFTGLSRQGPMIGHWFGGDNIGKDVFSRCIYGARKSLEVGIFSYLIALVIGGGIGLIAAYYRGRIEAVIVGILDVLLSFPPLLLLIALGAFLGAETKWLILALSILAIPSVARIIRSQVLIYREREFVLAARALGARNMRVMLREVLPNAMAAVWAFALIGVANLIVAEGALAFVGVSDPNEVSWGVMINQGRSQLDSAPHIVLFPSLMIVLTVLAMNYIGDKVQEVLAVKEAYV